MKRKVKNRVYFDYNIYEGIIKERITFTDDLLQQNEAFMSVAHVEEFYKACQNDIDNKNKDSLDSLKRVMLGICKPGIILNPGETRIMAKPQSFEACYDIVQKYDTRENVDCNGQLINQSDKEAVERLREHDNIAIHNSSLDGEMIWSRPEIIEGINAFPEYYCNYIIENKSVLASVYGVAQASLLNRKSKLPKEYNLYKGCFKDNEPNFELLQCVMEYLHNLLNKCGFHRDKELRKTKSGIHDVSHSIYGTYCNYFITLDYGFNKRLDAIYNFLGIETKVLSMNDFVKDFKKE